MNEKSAPAFTFDGFEPANTTPVPDVLFDELLSELSEAELKVLLYIIRRTAGFKKQTDAISLTQFQKGIKKRATGEILDKGCGVKDRATIIKALASLERKGCIESTKGSDPQGDAATSSYKIRFRSGVVGTANHPTDIGSGHSQPPWFAKPTTGSGHSQPGVVGTANPQETVIQSNSLQETDKQEGTYSAREDDEHSQPGAHAQPPARTLENTPYVPDSHSQSPAEDHANDRPADINHLLPGHDRRDGAAVRGASPVRVSPQQGTGHAEQPATGAGSDTRADRGAAQTGLVSENETRSQDTAQGASAGGSGYQKPAQATSGVPARKPGAHTQGKRTTKGNTNQRVYFSTEGAAFRQWYEEIFETQLDETAANARACNALGGRTSVTYENVKLVKQEIGLNKWARTNNVAVTPQDLADDSGPIRWEKWLQAAQKRAKKVPEKQATGTNNLADWIEEDKNRPHVSDEEARRVFEEAKARIAERKAAKKEKQTIYYQINPRAQGGENYA